MNIGNHIVEDWSNMIDSPISINGKQGFLLTNGMRILFVFSSLNLSRKAISILRRLRRK